MPSINYIQKKKLADKSWGTDICQGIKFWLMTDVLLLELETKENLPKDANIANINLTELSNFIELHCWVLFKRELTLLWVLFYLCFLCANNNSRQGYWRVAHFMAYNHAVFPFCMDSFVQVM